MNNQSNNIIRYIVFYLIALLILFISQLGMSEEIPEEAYIVVPQLVYQDPYNKADWERESIRVQIYERLNILVSRYPLYVQKRVYGRSRAGLDLIALEIHNELALQTGEKPTLVIACGIHPREVASFWTGLNAIENILEKTVYDSYTRFLLERKKIIYLPVMNPDGLEMVSQGFDWRKNTSIEMGYHSPFDAPYSFGVDLNRNFPQNFRVNLNPQSITYGGTDSLSEPETRYCTEYLDGQSVDIFLSLHSYGEIITIPWWGQTTQTENYFNNYFAASLLKEQMGDYCVGQGGGYDIYGNMGDWIYQRFGCLDFTIELGTDFYIQDEEIQDLTQRVELVILTLLEILGHL